MQDNDTSVTTARGTSRARVEAVAPWLARALPFAFFMGALALRGALSAPSTGMVELFPRLSFDGRWLYSLQALGALALLLALRPAYSELSALPRSAAAASLSVLAGLAVFFLWIAPAPAWMHLGSESAAFAPVDDQAALRWDLVTMRAFGAVAVVPVMEELFWRSFLLRWIDQRDFLSLAPARASWKALLLSSAVFALAHDLWLAAFLGGVVYAGLYRRTANLWYPVLAHATSNLALAVWVVERRAWSYW